MLDSSPSFLLHDNDGITPAAPPALDTDGDLLDAYSPLAPPIRAGTGRLIGAVIQPAPPLNPGTSGGAPASPRGGVIGINPAMIPGAQGICFAVAGNTVSFIVSQLIRHGRVRRA